MSLELMVTSVLNSKWNIWISIMVWKYPNPLLFESVLLYLWRSWLVLSIYILA